VSTRWLSGRLLALLARAGGWWPRKCRSRFSGRKTPGSIDYAFKFQPEPHTRIRDDYRESCRKYHKKFDSKNYNSGGLK
jgi:hypothetical protein